MLRINDFRMDIRS